MKKTKEEVKLMQSLQGQATALLKKNGYKFMEVSPKVKKKQKIQKKKSLLRLKAKRSIDKKKFFKNPSIKEFYQNQEFINHL